MRERAHTLSRDASWPQTPPTNEGWWPAYTAWQAFAVKVLVEGGRNQDSQHHAALRLSRSHAGLRAGVSPRRADRPRRATTGARVDDLRRRIANAILPEGGSAHVEELSDPYLLWFWNSNVRSTAIVLGALVRGERDADARSGRSCAG